MFSRFITASSKVCLLAFFAGTAAGAQVLARPGWAGSGVAPESWWPRAVFYRLDPARFQDSDGDGRGDLPGLARRLEYVRALGVDALVLDGSPAATTSKKTEPAAGAPAGAGVTANAIDPGALDTNALDPGALGDLVREASQHQLRVLLTVTPAMLRGPQPELLKKVHEWLGAGAAGVWVPRPAGALNLSTEEYTSLLASLGNLIRTFPGERVLLTDPAPMPLHLPTTRESTGTGQAHEAARGPGSARHLVTATLFAVRPGTVPSLRASLNAAGQATGEESQGLIAFAQPPMTADPRGPAYAAVLLGSRGAVMLDFGEELGLDLYPTTAPENGWPVMQWTPSNRTPADKKPVDATPDAHTGETQFGAYHPYQPPPRDLRGPLNTPATKVAPDMNLPPAPPDPNTLTGFSSAEVLSVPAQVAERNASTEDRDPRSLLNTFRALIALHHGNPPLRNGAQTVLPHDAEESLVWVRRAPAGTRTALPVIAAVNLSDKPVTLSLNDELEQARLPQGALRALFRSSTEAMTGESTQALLLPPHGVFLGEVVHAGRGGGGEGPAPLRGREGRHHRRHGRVRR